MIENIIKDYGLYIIILLILISLILFATILVDQFFIKKDMLEEISRLKKENERLKDNNRSLLKKKNEPEDNLLKKNSSYNDNGNSVQMPQINGQKIVDQRYNDNQLQKSQTTDRSQQQSANGDTATNNNNVSQADKHGSSNVPTAKTQTANTCTYSYLQEANGGKFLKTLSTPEKCFFRTWEEDGVRKFEFCGNVAIAIANSNAIFDEVCDIEGKQNGATDIENILAGTLDSELRITNKAKIRLK